MRKISGWDVDGKVFATREEAEKYEARMQLEGMLQEMTDAVAAGEIVDRLAASPGLAKDVARLVTVLIPPGERRAKRADAGKARGPREVKAA